MKLTNQREEIISYLQRTRSHPDASEVYNKVKKKLPRISLGTVYRNLDFLAKQNTIEKINMENYEKYDGNSEIHDHLICTNCHSIEDIPKLKLNLKNFEPKKVNIFGLCEKCNK
ncbi:transcriptional repressor [Candidatus Woesearchaeota archaeon]|nr:transcriptional repressor [Candidatus Woesearchaeota archaeon]